VDNRGIGGMKIILQNLDLDIFMYTTKDWQGGDVFVVVYGLQHTPHKNMDDAFTDYNTCVLHALVADGMLEDE
jgi:hypothetical protein